LDRGENHRDVAPPANANYPPTIATQQPTLSPTSTSTPLMPPRHHQINRLSVTTLPIAQSRKFFV
jgi:hypothetical protein